jgi:hypothetical protein
VEFNVTTNNKGQRVAKRISLVSQPA